MANLKSIVKEKLKDKVPIREIVQQLKERGYSKDEIKNLLEDVVIEMRRESSIKKAFSIVLIIGLIVGTGVTIYKISGLGTLQLEEKAVIQEFMEKNLREEYYPDSLGIKQLSLLPDIISVNGANWIKKWENKDITLSAIIQHDFMNGMKSLAVSVSLPEIRELDNSSARSLHQSFFKTTGIDWNCRNDNNLTICESFSQDKADAVVSPVGNLSITVIYSSKMYR